MTLTKKGPTWHTMIKSIENWAVDNVLPDFNELVIVVSGTPEEGSVLIEVANEGEKPYSSVGLDWHSKGAATIRHALDLTEENLVAFRGKKVRAAKKQQSKELNTALDKVVVRDKKRVKGKKKGKGKKK